MPEHSTLSYKFNHSYHLSNTEPKKTEDKAIVGSVQKKMKENKFGSALKEIGFEQASTTIDVDKIDSGKKLKSKDQSLQSFQAPTKRLSDAATVSISQAYLSLLTPKLPFRKPIQKETTEGIQNYQEMLATAKFGSPNTPLTESSIYSKTRMMMFKPSAVSYRSSQIYQVPMKAHIGWITEISDENADEMPMNAEHVTIGRHSIEYPDNIVVMKNPSKMSSTSLTSYQVSIKKDAD